MNLTASTIAFFGSFSAQADRKPTGQQVRVTCYFGKFSGDLQANSEIEELAWMTCQDIEQCFLVTQIVMKRLKLEGLID